MHVMSKTECCLRAKCDLYSSHITMQFAHVVSSVDDSGADIAGSVPQVALPPPCTSTMRLRIINVSNRIASCCYYHEIVHKVNIKEKCNKYSHNISHYTYSKLLH